MKHHPALFSLFASILFIASPVSAQVSDEIRLGAPTRENLPMVCQSLSDELKRVGHFDVKPSWKRINVAHGKFSLELPHADAWTDDGRKSILPYTKYDSNPSITIRSDGQTIKNIQAIHFGRLWLDDLCNKPGIKTELLSLFGSVREYSLGWEQGSLKDAMKRLRDTSYPAISLKLGIHDAAIIQQKDLLGVCGEPIETLLVQQGKRTYILNSPCRPLTIQHFRIANSIK